MSVKYKLYAFCSELYAIPLDIMDKINVAEKELYSQYSEDVISFDEYESLGIKIILVNGGVEFDLTDNYYVTLEY